MFWCLESVRQLFLGAKPDFAGEYECIFVECWENCETTLLIFSLCLLLVFVERYERLFENGTRVVLD